MKKVRYLRRVALVSSAFVLSAASMLSVFQPQKVSAYGLLTSREIRMSSSAGGGTTAGQDVTYYVRMTTPSNQTIGSLVIDFCGASPIIGDSNCTSAGSGGPAGFNINEAGLAIANQTGITDWAIDAATDTNTLVLTRTAANFNAGTFTFELGSSGGSDGITNPTASNTTFYGRILTFATNAGGQQYAPGDIDNAGANTVHHAGGVALSTADSINVQSKVQERLTFCVYTDGDSGTGGIQTNYTSCSNTSTANPVVLGDANGVLDPNTEYVSNLTRYNITTNASNGAKIRAKANPGTLTSNGNTITAIGATPTASTAGSEQFGFCTYRDTGGGTAGLTPVSKYNGDAGGGIDCSDTTSGAGGDNGSLFAFDLATACGSSTGTAGFGEGNLNCAYGDVIADKTAGNFSTGVVSFVGNISNTTEPGIYTTTMMFIATGNY